MRNKVTGKSIMLASLITFLLGLIQAFFPEYVISFLDYVVGIGFLSFGVVGIMSYYKKIQMNIESNSLVIGIILCILGIYFLLNRGFLLSIIALIFGVFIMLVGIIGIQSAINLKQIGLEKWKFSLAFSSINAFLGIIIVFNPFRTTVMLIIYIGIFMMISSVLNIFSLLVNNKGMKSL